jgi:hypothetical protein
VSNKIYLVFILSVLIALIAGLNLGKYFNNQNKITNVPPQVANDNPLPTITPTLIPGKTKIINSTKYVISKTENAQLPYLNFYKEENNIRTQLWEYFPPITSDLGSIQDFWYSETDKAFIVDEMLGGDLNGYYRISKYSPMDKSLSNIKLDTFYFKRASLYEAQKLLDYFPATNSLLVMSAWGDGCGGGGKIWMVNNNQTITEISKFGSGCVDYNLPRYMDYGNGDLYFTNEEESDLQNFKILSVFSLNPITRVKKTLLSSGEVPEEVHYLKVDPKQSDSLLFYDYGVEKPLYRLDIKSGTLSKL